VVRAHFLAEAIAIHPRHPDIRNNGVDVFAMQHFEGADTVHGFTHRPAIGFQLRAQQLQVARMVIYDENIHGTERGAIGLLQWLRRH
jgi:hypothetical protein